MYQEGAQVDAQHIYFHHHGCLSRSLHQTPSLLDKARAAGSLLIFGTSYSTRTNSSCNLTGSQIGINQPIVQQENGRAAGTFLFM